MGKSCEDHGKSWEIMDHILENSDLMVIWSMGKSLGMYAKKHVFESTQHMMIWGYQSCPNSSEVLGTRRSIWGRKRLDVLFLKSSLVGWCRDPTTMQQL
jgi:hypothetical protein